MTRKRLATVVYGVFGVGVGAFVIASIAQVVGVAFRPAPAAPLTPPCASGIRLLLTAVDRAAAAAEPLFDENAARVAFTAALSPEWDRKEQVRASCTAPDDAEAFAEALRLERMLEQTTIRRAREAGPLRKRLEARIGVEGRK